jgi:putative nucleotidyltransferase with HDIG domain
MLNKDKLIGIVQVLNRKDGKPFNLENQEIFTSLASQAAIAIDNARLYKDLRDLFYSTVKSLAEAIEAKSPYTHGHVERVSKFAQTIAQQLGLNEEDEENIYLSALLHDVGKIGIAESILNKPGRLNKEEWEEIKKHPTIGAEILAPVKLLRKSIPGVKSHQERYDGSGYPDGLKGEEIPLVARIICLADSFDVITSDRPYKKGLNIEDAIEEIKRCKGTQFDPKIADAFLMVLKKNKNYV